MTGVLKTLAKMTEAIEHTENTDKLLRIAVMRHTAQSKPAPTFVPWEDVRTGTQGGKGPGGRS